MHPQTRTCRPQLEVLEDRLVPTNFVAEFPGFGVFRLTTAGVGSQSLAQLTDLDANDVSIAPNGDVLAAIPPQIERSTGLFLSGGTVFFPASGAPPIRVNFFTPNRLDISGLPGLPIPPWSPSRASACSSWTPWLAAPPSAASRN